MTDTADLLTDAFAGALHEGRQAHVVIETARGPHVTPELYGFTGGRLWFFVAATTLKARRTTTGTRCGALVRAGARTVVLAGRLERVDPLAPRALAAALPALPGVPLAVAGYVARNAADLAGFARDAAAGRTGRFPPPRRVLLSVVADRAAFVDGDAPIAARGAWTLPDRAADGAGPGGRRGRSGRTPDVDGSVSGVVGLRGTDGPVALPVRWDPASGSGLVAEDLLALAGGGRPGPVSVVVDEYGRPGPAAKRGVLLRGDGTFEPGGIAGWSRLRVVPDRLTTWDGVRTGTSRLD